MNDSFIMNEDINNLVMVDSEHDAVIMTIPPKLDNSSKFELGVVGADYLIRKSSRDDNVTYLLANTIAGANVNVFKDNLDPCHIEFIHNNGFLMVINLPLTDELIDRIIGKPATCEEAI